MARSGSHAGAFDAARLNRLYRYAYALTASEADAFDLVHGAVERMLNRARAAPDDVDAYLRTSIRNAFLDACRRSDRFPTSSLDTEGELEVADLDATPLEQLVMDARELDAAWGRLTPTEREVLFLWAVEGHTMAEISDALGMPRGTLLSMVHRMRRRLRFAGTAPARHDAEGT